MIGNSGSGIDAGNVSVGIDMPAPGERRSLFPRKGLKSSSSGTAETGRGLIREGVRLAAAAMPPLALRNELVDPGVR